MRHSRAQVERLTKSGATKNRLRRGREQRIETNALGWNAVLLQRIVLQLYRSACVRVGPVKFSSFVVNRSGMEELAVDPRDRDDLRIVPSRENLIGDFEFLIRHDLLDDCYSSIPQQPNYSLPRNSVQERSVRDWCVDDPVFRHEDI